jgi:hypothetical protein
MAAPSSLAATASCPEQCSQLGCSYGSIKFTIRMAFLQIQHSFLTKMQNHNIHQLNSTKREAL